MVIIIISGSQSSIIGLCLAALLIGLFIFRGQNIWSKTVSKFATIVSVISIFLALSIINLQLLMIDAPIQFNKSLLITILGTDRYNMYIWVIETISENWLFGVGYGSFPKIMSQGYRKGFIAHGLFLRIWVGTGLLSIIPLIYSLSASVRGFISSRDRENIRSATELQQTGLCISFCSLLTIGFFNPVFLNPIFILLLSLGTGSLKS